MYPDIWRHISYYMTDYDIIRSLDILCTNTRGLVRDYICAKFIHDTSQRLRMCCIKGYIDGLIEYQHEPNNIGDLVRIASKNGHLSLIKYFHQHAYYDLIIWIDCLDTAIDNNRIDIILWYKEMNLPITHKELCQQFFYSCMYKHSDVSKILMTWDDVSEEYQRCLPYSPELLQDLVSIDDYNRVFCEALKVGNISYARSISNKTTDVNLTYLLGYACEYGNDGVLQYLHEDHDISKIIQDIHVDKLFKASIRNGYTLVSKTLYPYISNRLNLNKLYCDACCYGYVDGAKYLHSIGCILDMDKYIGYPRKNIEIMEWLKGIGLID